MEKTAVEWLVEKIISLQSKDLKLSEQYDKKLIEQAKEMEAKQRKNDFKAGNECACMCHENIEDYFKQYIKSE